MQSAGWGAGHWLCGAVSVVAVFFSLSARAEVTVDQGYIDLSDGVGLHYTLHLPPGEGPFPTLLVYSGYNAGNDPDDNFRGFVAEVVERGIAAIGVNVRGTGCSEGSWVPFEPQWADDGIAVVDWVAAQEWSDGNVAMGGVSFPAIIAAGTAARRPEALRALFLVVPFGDLYRDGVYPGGIFNLTFSSAWSLIQNYGTLFSIGEVLTGNLRCGRAILGQNDPRHLTLVEAVRYPYIDQNPNWGAFLTAEGYARIDVPVLGQVSWQDEQLGSRAWNAFAQLDPDRTWMVGGNSAHGRLVETRALRDQALDFLDHFLRGGQPQDFVAPRTQIWKEISNDLEPAHVEIHDQWPPVVEPLTLHAHPDGVLLPELPRESATQSYSYPLPAPSSLTLVGDPNLAEPSYLLPVLPGGSVALTTPALRDDLNALGSASFDLWLSVLSTGIDLQVSLVEVRPDGQEMYVQRGWLRSGHRKLDAAKSTAMRPVHTHVAADNQPMEPGVITPMRVEIMPFAHTFRAGSALRLYVEAPLGFTGFRQLALNPLPTRATVHIGPDTPTRLVLGRAEPARIQGRAAAEAPVCDLENQPCRSNATPIPEGEWALARVGQSGGGGGFGMMLLALLASAMRWRAGRARCRH